MNPEMVGKSVQVIADAVGIQVPAGTRLLVGQIFGVGSQYPLSREILSPVVAYYTADNLFKPFINIINRCMGRWNIFRQYKCLPFNKYKKGSL